MPISFGRRSKVPINKAADLHITHPGKTGEPQVANSFPLPKNPARLVDLRSAESFREGFIPGSYSVPDLGCWQAARGSGLFNGREIYFLADDPQQVALCEEFGDLGEGSALAGWFGVDALEEWRKAIIQIGTLEAIRSDTLAIRLASWNTIVLDILENESAPSRPNDHAALRFHLNELPLSLDGLPVETSVCVTAASLGVSSFAASLLWNFGFHKASYLLK